MINNGGQFHGIFEQLRKFAKTMPTYAAEINDEFEKFTWPAIDNMKAKAETMETNLMAKKKLLLDMLEFLQIKARALKNEKELSDLKAVLNVLPGIVDNSTK
ncbi:unnamed protein product [Meloidogyne enterolobii]|uniref:Uncharacterized protein n=1 Tax=Meloidogyne enterolobii TaxID=390850 RepID=A0ACB1ATC1_MELEN